MGAIAYIPINSKELLDKERKDAEGLSLVGQPSIQL